MRPSRDLIHNHSDMSDTAAATHTSLTFEEPQVDHIVKNVPTFRRNQKLIFLFLYLTQS